MAVALSYQGSFGFALQAERGSFTAPTNWLPLMPQPGGGPADSLALHHNYVSLDLADAHAYQSRYYRSGQWVAGQVRFPLIPGAMADVLNWIQDRDAAGQGRWASAVVDCVHQVKQLTDLKVRRASFDLVAGEPVLCTLDLAGLKMEAGLPASPQMPLTPPFLYREAALSLSKAGVPEAEAHCERLRIVIDTALHPPAEGLRLAPGHWPRELYNLGGLRAWGSFSRDFVDAAVWADFATGTEAALGVTLQRDAAVATLTLPRLLYTEDYLGLPGSHEQRLVERVDFLALGSLDGAVPPVVLG